MDIKPNRNHSKRGLVKRLFLTMLVLLQIILLTSCSDNKDSNETRVDTFTKEPTLLHVFGIPIGCEEDQLKKLFSKKGLQPIFEGFDDEYSKQNNWKRIAYKNLLEPRPSISQVTFSAKNGRIIQMLIDYDTASLDFERFFLLYAERKLTLNSEYGEPFEEVHNYDENKIEASNMIEQIKEGKVRSFTFWRKDDLVVTLGYMSPKGLPDYDPNMYTEEWYFSETYEHTELTQ